MSEELLEAMADVQCNCSLRERESGHRTECWMPALREAVNALQADAQRKDEALREIADVGAHWSRIRILRLANAALSVGQISNIDKRKLSMEEDTGQQEKGQGS